MRREATDRLPHFLLWITPFVTPVRFGILIASGPLREIAINPDFAL